MASEQNFNTVHYSSPFNGFTSLVVWFHLSFLFKVVHNSEFPLPSANLLWCSLLWLMTISWWAGSQKEPSYLTRKTVANQYKAASNNKGHVAAW